jgi:hypothetical protein
MLVEPIHPSKFVPNEKWTLAHIRDKRPNHVVQMGTKKSVVFCARISVDFVENKYDAGLEELKV